MSKGTLLIVLGLLCLSSVGAKLGSNKWDTEFGPFPSAQDGDNLHIAVATPSLSSTDAVTVAAKNVDSLPAEDDAPKNVGSEVSVDEKGVPENQATSSAGQEDEEEDHQAAQMDAAQDDKSPAVSSSDAPKARNRANGKDRTRFRKYQVDFPGEEQAQGGEVTVIERGVPSASGNMMASGSSVAEDFPQSMGRRGRDESSMDGERTQRDSGADNPLMQGSDTDNSPGPQDDGQDSLPIEIQPPAFDGSEDMGGNSKGTTGGDDEYDDNGEKKHKVFDFSAITYAQIPLHHWAWLTAVVFVMLTCIISLSMIVRHLEYYGELTVRA
jgi:hypothetical protein